MASAVSREIVVDVPVERFFDLLVDYARYPEFVPGIKACRVRSTRPHKDVEYELDVGIKRIRYVLRHVEERPSRVSWSLVSGDVMKVSNGSWDLADAGGKTRARYSLEVQIARPPLIPQMVVDKIADEHITAGEHAGNVGDDYVRITVVLAGVLFLVGIGSTFPMFGVRYALLGVGGALLVTALVFILHQPGPPT